MSAGRAFRRRLRDLRAGSVLYLLPELREGLHPELLNALERRRRASTTGRCDCGATFVFDGPLEPGKTTRAVMEHVGDCPASDAGIAALVESHGWPT